MKNIVHIYHTNDLHSHLENWPKITQFIYNRRQNHEKDNEKVFLFDIGDHVDRFHPLTEATAGKANVQLLNKLQYQSVTIGNNEGITLTKEELNQLYEDAEFHVVVANLFQHDGSKVEWSKPYHIYELDNDVTMAVIGLTAPYKKFYEILGWEIKDPIETLHELIPQVKNQANIIVLLSHLGIYDDERIANQFPEIDLILGGHTHHHLKHGKRVNKTMLCCAYKYGFYVGHATLEIDSQLKKVNNIYVNTINMDNQIENQNMLQYIHEISEKSKGLLMEEIAIIDRQLDLDWFKPSPFPSLLAEALQEWCDTEIGMVNAGVLLEPLKIGSVTKSDLHRICPHPINPCKVLLKGNELKEVIIQANTDKMERLELKGFGFRGKVLGRMTFSGVEVETIQLDDGERHVRNILINGEPLDVEKVYSVGTIDMFTFGQLYPEISRAKSKHYYLPEMLRDVLAWKLSK